MRAAGLEPLEPYPGSLKAWRCRCLGCLNDVTPTYANVRNGHGCRYCAEVGIDYTQPAVVYLLHHPLYEAYKLGIAQHDSIRTSLLARHGWAKVRTYAFATAAEAERVEQTVLVPYRSAGLCPFLSSAEMPLGGHTETIDAEAVSALDLWAEVVAAAEGIEGTTVESANEAAVQGD